MRHGAAQFLGPDDETLTLSGVLLPEFAGSRLSLELLEAMATTGRSWPLIQGDGLLYGEYLITGIQTTGTLHFQDGAPRKIEFQLTLKRTDSAWPWYNAWAHTSPQWLMRIRPSAWRRSASFNSASSSPSSG